MAVEVKAAKTVRQKDFAHIDDLRASLPNVESGVIFYLGDAIVPFGKNHAVPLAIL